MTQFGVGGDFYSSFYGWGQAAINDAGQVVGQSGWHAFITGPDGMGMRNLGILGVSARFHHIQTPNL